ncbi:MAG: cytochrome c biogenesis protein CcdA [Kiritimatiellia bacterium]|nr:cytochrome c biogenesis protein CcdA [Kiritimatiellia bacterium]
MKTRLFSRTVLFLSLLCGLWIGSVRASPFHLTAERMDPDGRPAVRIRFEIPPEHALYPEWIRVTTADGTSLEPLLVPEAVQSPDPTTGEIKALYAESFEATYVLPPDFSGPVRVTYQGCNPQVCFIPVTVDLNPDSVSGAEGAPADSIEGFSIPDDFDLRATAVGYMREGEFLEFLAQSGEAAAPAPSERGVVLTMLLILLGGVALNLTPCVLPMIPINLAIIGAGARASSRRRGFGLGALYGLGMALAYGALGAVVILTGSQFGTLNASPVFNAGIAVLFGILALAMFDVIPIDLSRFQSRLTGSRSSSAGLWVVFGMGIVSALLAGACVAPVVLAVILLAGAQVAAGNWAGLFWPFLLGAGMALPWPLAGAGMAKLPKPGVWMNKIKALFGIFILLLAFYYGHLAWQGWSGGSGKTKSEAIQEEAIRLGGPSDTDTWDKVWEKARAENKPVFIDFWATWCKNCEAMERTTFRRPAVQARFDDFVVVQYQAERTGEEPARTVLEKFGVRGLPTYAILVPK